MLVPGCKIKMSPYDLLRGKALLGHLVLSLSSYLPEKFGHTTQPLDHAVKAYSAVRAIDTALDACMCAHHSNTIKINITIMEVGST